MTNSKKIKECKRLINVLKSLSNIHLNLFICNVTTGYKFDQEFREFLQQEMKHIETKYPDIAKTTWAHKKSLSCAEMVSTGNSLWYANELEPRIDFLKAVIKSLS